MDASALIALAATVLFALAFASLRRVPDGQVHTVYRFGRYVRALPPGFHLVWPLVERVRNRVLLIGHRLRLPAEDAGKGLGGAELYYQILDPARTGEALERVDAVVLDAAAVALREVSALAGEGAQGSATAGAEAFKQALNRHISGRGLRIIRCSLHPG